MKEVDKKEQEKEHEKEVKIKKHLGIDAFVLSIVSMLTILLWYICIPASIYSIVRSAITSKKSGSKIAKASLIISLTAITLCVAIYSQIIFQLIVNY